MQATQVGDWCLIWWLSIACLKINRYRQSEEESENSIKNKRQTCFPGNLNR